VDKMLVEEHRHQGVFIARGKNLVLATRNSVPGVSVYGEKRIKSENSSDRSKTEFRVWNPSDQN